MATFFDISNENIFWNNLDSDGIFFLWWRNAKPNIMMLDNMTPPDQTPDSNGSGVIGGTPGILTVSDARINAGKITEMKLISTIDMENRNTIHGIIVFFVPESRFLGLFSFSNLFVHNHTCLKFKR